MTDDLVEKVARAIADTPNDATWLDTARAALSAIEEAGWCVVPVDPTWEMAKAGKGMMPVEYDLRTMTTAREPEFPVAQRLVAVGFEHPNKQAKPDAVYTAMLSARPRITGETT